MMDATRFKPSHFGWTLERGVATITLDRPAKKNPLTFESYAELRDTFVGLRSATDVRAVVLTGAGDNFCAGGDVHEIIEPLLRMDDAGREQFARMTGDLVIAMLTCPQVIVAAIDGVCVGAGAALAMASDLRFGTERARVAFLFVKVGLGGCDMGSCAMLPRIIGQGRAAELLYTGRTMAGEEALRWGFFNRLCDPEQLHGEALAFARAIADGPIAAHRATKKQLLTEWNLDLVRAIEDEARAQAVLMGTQDFRRAYEAFVRREAPRFEGD